MVLLGFPGSGFSIGKQPKPLNHVITVDDEPGDADYTSIKEAVSHANPGDTIEVYSGTYYEAGITVTQEGLSLIGMPYELGNGTDTGKPFINGMGQGDLVILNACNVTVSGFRIEHGGELETIILIHKDGCIVSNNTMHLSGNIMQCISSHCMIINNIMSDAGFRVGFGFGETGQHNLVSDNIIDNCPTGIGFWGGDYNTIIRNQVSNCSEFGIDMAGCTGNTFRFNTIENNSYGLHVKGAHITVEMNNFMNNGCNAGFNQGSGFIHGNRWRQNYWDGPRTLPYPIKGIVLVLLPWVQFDWRPALQPYNITLQ